MQLCVGDEVLFPLAKPTRSFQNLTEKSALIILLLSKSRKNGHTQKRKWVIITNKTFTPKTDLDFKFYHCGNVRKGCNHFFGEKTFLLRSFFIYILNAATPCSHIRVVKTPLHPLTYNKTGVYKSILLALKHRL